MPSVLSTMRNAFCRVTGRLHRRGARQPVAAMRENDGAVGTDDAGDANSSPRPPADSCVGGTRAHDPPAVPPLPTPPLPPVEDDEEPAPWPGTPRLRTIPLPEVEEADIAAPAGFTSLGALTQLPPSYEGEGDPHISPLSTPPAQPLLDLGDEEPFEPLQDIVL